MKEIEEWLAHLKGLLEEVENVRSQMAGWRHSRVVDATMELSDAERALKDAIIELELMERPQGGN